MATLPWQCSECKASFFTQQLLSIHNSVFHKEVSFDYVTEITCRPDFAASSHTDDSDGMEETERERLEKKFRYVKVVQKLPDVSEVGANNESLKTEEEEYLEDSDCEAEHTSQSELLEHMTDDDTCILVVRDDEMYFAENDVQNNASVKAESSLTEDASQDEPDDSDDSDPAWSADETKQTSNKSIKHSARVVEKSMNRPDVSSIKMGLEFKCKRCEQVFPTKHERRLHMETHARDLRFFCSECGRGFRKNQGLQLHLNVHREGSRHQCPYCNNFYRTDRYLKEHVKLHMPEEYKFVCEICKKAFAHKTAYKYHMRSHFNVTPYICRICGKGYRQKPSLEAHMNMHEGARPYTCGTCGAGFRMKHTLRDHERLHTNERPFACKYPGCTKAYVLKNQLKTHTLKHTGEKMHACRLLGCDKRFFFDSHRARHENTAHRASAAPPSDEERESYVGYIVSELPGQS